MSDQAAHGAGHSALRLVLRRWRPRGTRRHSRSSHSTRAAPSRCWSAPRRAASTTSRRGWRRDICRVSFRATRTSSSRTIRAAAASSPPTASISIPTKDGTVLAKLERAVPQLAIQGNPQRPVRSGKVHLARQPVVLCRRRLSDAGQCQSCGQDHRRPQDARRVGDAGRRQCRVEQPDLRRRSPRRCSAST